MPFTIYKPVQKYVSFAFFYNEKYVCFPVIAGVIFNTATAQRIFFNMARERAVAGGGLWRRFKYEMIDGNLKSGIEK